MSSSLEINDKEKGEVQKGAACTRETHLYMRSKREQEREYMRTCRTMPVISFTSSELEDYQLQLVLRSVDQIASQFVHRLFFLTPSSSSSSSCFYYPLSPVSSLFSSARTHARTHAPFFSSLISVHIVVPEKSFNHARPKSKDEEDTVPSSRKCHIEFS